MSEEKKKLLLVEDDPSFGAILKDYLILNHYDVVHAIDGESGLQKFKEGRYDIAIFDVLMPKKDGFTLAREVKKIDSSLPIIFLTARDDKADVLNGYRVGADDYLTKPFDTEVLLCKIKAILQRNGGAEPADKVGQIEFKVGDFDFNSKLRLLKIDNKEFRLSPKESELLRLMAINLNDLMPRELALMRIWQDDNYFTSRSMDVYIAKLRKYLKEDPKVEIVNIHGEGFRLAVNSC
ncbi:MAG: response regulator transcription factor [Flavobacteriales bacterium]